jgi:hypothetical protein
MSIKYSGITKRKKIIYITKQHKNYIYNKKYYKGGDLPISPRSSPGRTDISGSLEKSILA